MSRRAKGFKFISGRSLEMRMLEGSGGGDTLSSSCRSLSSLASCSSDDPLLTANRRPDPEMNSFDNRSGIDGYGVGGGGGGGSADRVLMRRRPPTAGKRGHRRGLPPISWSNDSLSVVELAGDHAKRFPVIVKVTQGYYGDGKLQLPVGQVLQIYASCTERRVKAIDAAGRRLSFPWSRLDDMTVQLIDSSDAAVASVASSPLTDRTTSAKSLVGTNRGGLKLSEVLQKNLASLPLTVAVNSSNNNSSSSSRMQNPTNDSSAPIFPLGTYLTIESFYDCTYLLGNVIENGWLDSSSIILIPEDLGPSFTIALGLKDGSTDVWKDFSGMFDRSARHIKFSAIEGYDGVIYDDWSEFSLTYSTDGEEPEESGAAVDIDRYLINKQHLIPNNPDRCRPSPDDPDQGRSAGQGGRFPKTSPRLSINKRLTTHNAPTTPQSSTSMLNTSPYVESLGLTTGSVRSTSELSNRFGQNVNNMRDLSLHADYANVNITRTDRNKISPNSRPTEKVSRGANQQHSSPVDRNLNKDSAALGIDDITLEEVTICPQNSKVASLANKSDNGGTLISIDEGYNSGRCFSVSVQPDVTTSVGKRYSPVFF